MTNHLATNCQQVKALHYGHGNVLCPVAVVLVQRGTVHGPAEGAGYEGILHADPVDENGGEDAEEAHKAEDERVARVDLEVLGVVWGAR